MFFNKKYKVFGKMPLLLNACKLNRESNYAHRVCVYKTFKIIINVNKKNSRKKRQTK